MTTVAEALREATRRLESVSDTARLDAELLMAHALRVSRSNLLLRETGREAPAGFAALVERRERHEPVAYIRGRQEFYGRDFLVGPDVLIPRADSETTVEAALAAFPAGDRVLDCGTGSGALLLTVLSERPGSTGIGIDRSPEALAVAADNAERLGLSERCDLRFADWTESGWAARLGQFDLVVANPPYVETSAELDRSVRDHEPAGALFAGPEGLDDYRVLIPQLPQLLAQDGAAVLEIGASQADSVTEIAASCGFSAELYCDLAERPRALVLRLRTWQSAME
ncbi:peptide chain release factor N(5)-glutamine methyltransferase [Altererythrobacter salegens]|uniref:Release factor glutamine methyltransferase n=1 Tax=Croceibacterium salegens TaxID=1737568 RepID=A0A6I4T0K0_9SPHN|nr:peptide chain release factor N(5)-glutamine methyltransferase [Croceibacterium salegens]MXO61129.1 peptide chain release factor N(5)-glutamine methyltransferase [Croceibacterium salegens]